MKTVSKYLLYILSLAPLVVTKSLFFPFISGKSILIRLVVTLVSILAVSAFFSKKDFRSDMRARLRTLWKNKVFLFTCIFFGIVIVSTIFSVNPYRAFFGDVERAEGLLTLLFIFGFFLFSALLFDLKDWMRFFKLSVLTGGVLFVQEMIQFTQRMTDRPSGSTGNPIYLAAIFLFVIFAAALVIRDTQERRMIQKGTFDIFWFATSWAMIPLSLFGIFVTQTRGVIAGLVVAIVVLAAYFLVKIRDRRIGKYSIGTISLSILALIGVFGIVFVATHSASAWKYIPGLDRLSEFTLKDPTLQTRLISLGVSLHAINPAQNGVEKLLVGWGPENFSIAYNDYYNPQYLRYEQAWFDRAHNKLMDVLVMNGAFGLIAYMGMWIALWWGVSRRKFSIQHAAILFFGVAYFFQNLFVFDSIVTYIPFFAFVSFSAYRLSFSESEKAEKQQQKETETAGSFWPGYAGGVFALFFTFAFIAWTIIPYSQVYGYIQLINQPKTTQLDFQKVFAPYTFVQEVIRQHFLKNITQQYDGTPGDTKLMQFAIQQVQDVADREPYNPRYYILLGEAYDMLGKGGVADSYPRAEQDYRKAMELAPRRQDVMYLLAYDLSFQKRFGEAISLMQQAVDYDPQVPSPHFYLGMVLTGSGDPKNYERGFDELKKGEEMSGYAYGLDKNGPQAVYFLMANFYGQHNAAYTLAAADLLQKLTPDRAPQIAVVRKEVQNKTWKPIVFK